MQRSVNMLPWTVRQRVHELPAIAAFQRWVIARFLAEHEFLHTINRGPGRGLRMYVTLPRDKALWTGTYETFLAQTIAKTVRPGDICYDVGAFRGFMSGVMALAGAKRVVAFDPLPRNVEQLRRLVLINPDLSLDVHACAIGARDEQAAFDVMPDDSMGKLRGSKFQTQRRGNVALRVPMRSIDSLVNCYAIPPPDVLKIDVEGAETEVLEGAREVLRKHRPRLFIEAHSPDLARQCSSLLSELGYYTTKLERIEREQACESEVSHLQARSLK